MTLLFPKIRQAASAVSAGTELRFSGKCGRNTPPFAAVSRITTTSTSPIAVLGQFCIGRFNELHSRPCEKVETSLLDGNSDARICLSAKSCTQPSIKALRGLEYLYARSSSAVGTVPAIRAIAPQRRDAQRSR